MSKLHETLPNTGALFVEKAESAEQGIWEIRVIQSGEGSSGFYPAEVLERDGARAFPAGTRSFANHDSWEDLMNGGDITRLMGKTLESATYRDGALWATWQAAPKWRDFVKEFHEQIGVSINTPGAKEVGTVGEYTGNVITALENGPYTSIDVVVAPGAGGGFTRMLESAKEILSETLRESTAPAVATHKENERKSQMEIEDVDKKVDLLVEKFSAIESFIALATPLLETLKPAETDPEATTTAAVKVAYDKAIEAKLPAQLRAEIVALVEADASIDIDAAVKGKVDLIESLRSEISEDAGTLRESSVVTEAKTLIPRSWK